MENNKVAQEYFTADDENIKNSCSTNALFSTIKLHPLSVQSNSIIKYKHKSNKENKDNAAGSLEEMADILLSGFRGIQTDVSDPEKVLGTELSSNTGNAKVVQEQEIIFNDNYKNKKEYDSSDIDFQKKTEFRKTVISNLFNSSHKYSTLMIKNENESERSTKKEIITPKDPIECPAPPQRKRSKPLKFKLITTIEDEEQKLQQQTNELCEDPFEKLHFVKYIKQKDKPIRIWECGICPRQFHHQFELTRHLPVHAMDNYYTCSICSKGFKQLSTLSQHKAMHSRAKPYVCEVCLKCFARVSSLISHKKIHLIEKQFKCNICGKGFTQKANMQKHVQTHKQTKPFRCEVCNRGFYHLANLLCHKVKTHPDITDDADISGMLPLANENDVLSYRCSICNKAFKTSLQLQLHVENIHIMKVILTKQKPIVPKILHLPANVGKISLQSVNKMAKLKYTKNLKAIHKEVLNKNLTGISKIHIPMMYLNNNKKIKAKEFSSKVNRNYFQSSIDEHKEQKITHGDKQSQQMGFALFKPLKGAPILVKILKTPFNKQILCPATAEDLKEFGKTCMTGNNDEATKTEENILLKIPLTAAIAQTVTQDGQMIVTIEPMSAAVSEEDYGDRDFEMCPTEDEIYDNHYIDSLNMGDSEGNILMGSNHSELSMDLLAPLTVQPESLDTLPETSHQIHFFRDDGSMLTETEMQSLNQVNLVVVPHQEQYSVATINRANNPPEEESSSSAELFCRSETPCENMKPNLSESIDTIELPSGKWNACTQLVCTEDSDQSYQLLIHDAAEHMLMVQKLSYDGNGGHKEIQYIMQNNEDAASIDS